MKTSGKKFKKVRCKEWMEYVGDYCKHTWQFCGRIGKDV